MRNTLSQSTLAHDLAQSGSQIPIREARDVKRALLYKYRTLSKAAQVLDVDYNALSQVLNGRTRNSYILTAIKDDLSLTDTEISALFPKPMTAREFKLAQASA